ncbi:MAG: hypothetical protein NT068_00640 [Candidatus Nomurabacteria bacterium]|nr:hypothetical protein [Candidatus Nomurabacteria bacterium]
MENILEVDGLASLKGKTLNFTKLSSSINHAENAEILYKKDKVTISKSTIHQNMYHITKEKGAVRNIPKNLDVKIGGIALDKLSKETFHGVLHLDLKS